MKSQKMGDVLSLDLIEQNLISLIQDNDQFDISLTKITGVLGESFGVDGCFILTNQQDNNPYFDNIEIWEKKKKKRDGKKKQNEQKEILNLLIFDSELIVKLQNRDLFIINNNIVTDKFPFTTLLGCYTRCQNQINGLVILALYQPYEWTEKEQNTLINISNILGITLGLQWLHYSKEITINSLKSLTQKLRSESDQEKIFNLIFTETAHIFKADRCLFFLLKYSQPVYKNKVATNPLKGKVNLVNEWILGEGIKKPEAFSGIIGDCPFWQKLKEKAPEILIFTELMKELTPEETKKISPILKTKIYQGMVMIPLVHHSKNYEQPFVILGVVIIQYKKPHFWTLEEKILVDWISLQMSNNIIQSQALRQVQSIVDERTSQLKWSLDVQNKLSEKMRQQIQQLQKLNELKDDFMSSMSHELNTPLTTMKIAIKMLRQTGDFSDRQIRYLDILEEEWNREFNLIKDLLTLQKLESRQFIVDLKEIEIEPILTDIFQQFENRWADKGLKLEWNINGIRQPLKIYTDQESLINIINELLSNAGKYAFPDTLVIFNLDQELNLAQENLILEVSNCGAGISAEEIPYIFDKFRRGQGNTDQAIPGTGLGLTLVKMLIQQLNGTIEVNSEKASNSENFITTFTVILPRIKLS
jgi:signal transduction histidine kinase